MATGRLWPALWLLQAAVLLPSKVVDSSSSQFAFSTTSGGWEIQAGPAEVKLTWIASGVTWSSPLLGPSLTRRFSYLNNGCWDHSKGWRRDVNTLAELQHGEKQSGGDVVLDGIIRPARFAERSIAGNMTITFAPEKSGSISFKVDVKMAQDVEFPTISRLHRPGGAQETYKWFATEISLQWRLAEGERLFGAGEQYSMVNLQGQKFPIWSGEQGIGRGLQPISRSMGAVAWPCSGDPHTTYSAVPTLLSSAGYGIALDNSQLINVDLTGPVARMTAVFERADSSPAAQMQVSGHIWTGFDVRSLLVGLTDITGRMGAPPQWTQEGLIIGAEGGHKHVSKIIDTLLAAKVPVAGVWIQDWSGKVVTKTGVFVWWNWKLDQEMYPKAWLREVNAKGIKVMTYINPFLTNENKTNGVQPDLFLEADRLGYLVQDQEGKSILKPVSFAKFLYGTVDVFNPEAHKWWINVIRCNVMMACEDGKPSEPLVHGWMHDYGEYLPLGAAAREGGPQGFATDLHNQFPRYSQETAVAASAGYPNVTFFARSGDLRSPGVTKMFWLGDQLTSYDACDGLQSALIGAMSGGLSGWTVNHADIGAFTMFNRAPWLPLDVHFMRDSELNVRWLELSVFINAIFRSHPGLNPDLSSQLWDQNILEHTRHMSLLFQDLTPYRQSLFGEAATKGLPLVRHGVLVQPDDPAWFSASNVSSGNKHCRLGAKMLGDEIGLSQFFFGDDVLVVPALQQGQTSVQAYIPEGSWIHFWLNKTVHGPTYSSWDTTLGKPNFFYRDNSTWTGFFRRLSERYASDLETVLI